MKTLLTTLVVAAMIPALSSTATTINFQGLEDGESVGQFYNGGYGGQGSYGGDRVDYAVSFHHPAIALISSQFGGSGNVDNLPAAGDTSVVAFANDDYSGLEFYNGITSLSLWYSSPTANGNITVASGKFGTGTRTVLPYSTNSTGCNGATALFSCWTQLNVDFSGVAKSVVISGAGSFKTYFTDLQFEPASVGSPPAVPEPSTWITMIVGFAAVGVAHRRKRVLA